MVYEIRKRASNQSTEAASIAIVKYLELVVDNTTNNETTSGWLLLTTLNILANGDNNLIQVSSGVLMEFAIAQFSFVNVFISTHTHTHTIEERTKWNEKN